MEKNKKILLGGIIVVIVAVGTVISQNKIFVEPLPEPVKQSVQLLDLSPEAIANWSVCRNEKYGYEFKYPRRWFLYLSISDFEDTVQASCETGATHYAVSSISKTDYVGYRERKNSKISISATNKKQLISGRFAPPGGYPEIKSIHDYRVIADQTPEGHIPVIKESLIGGEVALWLSYPSYNFSANIELLHKDTVFGIMLQQINPELEKAILSTFKFID